MEKKESGKLGLLHTTTILIGGMIGSAIFSLAGITFAAKPGSFDGGAGASAIIAWVIAGLVLLAYGLICAELCSIYPNSGGVFMFPAKSLGKTEKEGRLWGWISAWSYLFGCIGGVVFSAQYVSLYLGMTIFPGLVAYGEHGPYTVLPGIIVGVAVVLICGVLNMFKIAVTGKANTALTALLAFTMLILIGVSLFGGKFDASNFTPFFRGSTAASQFAGFSTAIPVAMLAYGSIVAAAFMVGEIKDPSKTIPKAMSIAMAIVVALYVLTMVATIGLISADTLAQQFGQYTPQINAVKLAFGENTWLAGFVAIAAVLGLVTTALVLVILAARTIQATALSGILPKGLGANNAKMDVPLNATILVTVVCMVLAAFPALTNFIINFGALTNVFVVVILCVTIIAARKKNPPPAFRAPGGTALPIVTMLLLVACYAFGIYGDITGGTYDVLSLILATAAYFIVGLCIYFVGIKASAKNTPQ